MTYAQLQTEAAGLAELSGYTNTATAPDWPTLVNQAYTDLCWEAEALRGPEAVMNSVVGQSEYNLAAPAWKLLTDVLFNGVGLQKTSEAMLRRENPEWLVQANNTPTRYFQPREGVMRLYPVPNVIAVMTLYGVRAPAALSANGDIPLAPSTYHLAIAERAAWWHIRKYARQDDAVIVDKLDAHFQVAVEAWKQEVVDGAYGGDTNWYKQEIVPEAIYI